MTVDLSGNLRTMTTTTFYFAPTNHQERLGQRDESRINQYATFSDDIDSGASKVSVDAEGNFAEVVFDADLSLAQRERVTASITNNLPLVFRGHERPEA